MNLREIVKEVNAEKGYKIRRKSWGNPRYIVYIKPHTINFFKCGDANFNMNEFDPWSPNSEDILAEDWEFYEEPEEKCEACKMRKNILEERDRRQLYYPSLIAGVGYLLYQACTCREPNET